MGRFIAIDGLDGSGKATQTQLLCETLEQKGLRVRKLSFPMYDNKSSEFVRMYLGGELGSDPNATNAYAASTFFALDRYVSWRTDWGKEASEPDVVTVSDRYSTANAIHQLSKLDEAEWDGFLSWLWDFEYDKLGIPKPDEVLYLEMEPEVSLSLIRSRCEKTGAKPDIHESPDHLYRAYKAGIYAAGKLGWTRIACCENGTLLPREEIHGKILSVLGY